MISSQTRSDFKLRIWLNSLKHTIDEEVDSNLIPLTQDVSSKICKTPNSNKTKTFRHLNAIDNGMMSWMLSSTSVCVHVRSLIGVWFWWGLYFFAFILCARISILL